MSAANRKKSTRGMALVELALVIMILVLLTFGVMEYGWLFFRVQQVTNIAWCGARKAVLPDSTNLGVQQTVDALMTAYGIYGGYTLEISSSDITSLDPGQILTVTVQVPTENVQLMGLPIFPLPANLRSSASLAKEGPATGSG